MQKLLFLATILLLCSTLFSSCKKTSQPTQFIGNWTVTDTFPPNNTIVNLNLNVIDKSHYIFSGTVGDTALAKPDTGTYSISGDLVTFTSTGSTSPCLGHPGQYSYGVYSTSLSLILYNDNCNFGLSPRADYLTSTNWLN